MSPESRPNIGRNFFRCKVIREGGIFSEYINKFYQRKIEASGYPPQCTTDDEKDRYIQEVSRHEGIELERD